MSKKKEETPEVKETRNEINEEEAIEHYCLFEMRLVPKPVSDIKKIAKDLIHWADTEPKTYKITQFLKKYRLHTEAFYRWCKRVPELDDARKYALGRIGERREIGALEKELDSAMVRSTMAHYDTDHRKLMEWEASLKAKEEEKKNNVTVILEKYPESNMVPEKKDE